MQKLSRTFKVLLAMFLAVFSSGLVQLYQSPLAAAAPDDNKKVFVCKYVSTPGGDEVPSSVISVGVGSHNYQPGDLFVDAQGMSYVLAIDSGQPKPSISTCPIFTTPPLAPTWTDPCNPVTTPMISNIYWNTSSYSNTSKYTWTLGANNSLTVTAVTGYLFKTSSTTYVDHITYLLPADSGVVCANVVVPIPATPSILDPCNAIDVVSNASWVVPANTISITWTLAGGVLTATTNTGYVFTDGSTAKSFGVAVDSGIKCPVATPTAAASTVCDSAKIGITNGSASVVITNIDDTYNASASYSWTLSQNSLTLQSGSTAVVADGGTTTVALNSLVAGTYDFSIVGSDGSSATIQITIPQCEPEVVIATPPTPFDLCYNNNDYIIIPATPGVEYQINGSPVMGSIAYTGDPIVVTAIALPGYVISGDSSWTYDSEAFTNKECVTLTKSAEKPVDTNKDGVIGVGDTLSWTITVTNNGSTDVDESFLISLLDEGATFTDEVPDFIGAGETITLHVTKPISVVEAKACKATNTASLVVWLNGFEDRFSDNMGANKYLSATADAAIDCLHTIEPAAPTVTPITACGTYGKIVFAATEGVVYTLTSGDGKQGTYVVTATAQPGYEFTDGSTTATFTGTLGSFSGCVLGESTVVTTPPKLTLPATIPATGPADVSAVRSFITAGLLAVIAYGAVYFAQGRRYAEEN